MRNRVVIVKDLLTTYVEVEADSDSVAIEKAQAMIDSGEIIVARDCDDVSRTFEIGTAREELESRIADSRISFS